MIGVPLDDISRQADFIIGITGDSMEPSFKDGDLVYVEKTNHRNSRYRYLYGRK